MACSSRTIVFSVHTAPHSRRVLAPLRPVVEGCGLLEGSGLMKPPPKTSPGACNAGWRPTKTQLSSSGCTPGGRGGFSSENSRSIGPRLRSLRESWVNRTHRESLIMARAEKEGNGIEETTSEDANETRPPFAVKESGWMLASWDFWLQVAIFIFAAGFVDAGFSGDWSRIGVLSKEAEVDLQIAAIGIVPLAATLIWSISERRKQLCVFALLLCWIMSSSAVVLVYVRSSALVQRRQSRIPYKVQRMIAQSFVGLEGAKDIPEWWSWCRSNDQEGSKQQEVEAY